MQVNIYYGGRGLIDDPTLYTIEKIAQVLDELRVTVERYNLYEDKSGISVLPKTLKDADGVILAASVEWYGIGGYLQQFLDACWLYGDKEKIQHIYMLPVVMATTYGEREAQASLIRAWEMLGGLPCEGICAYVDNHVEFETNSDYGLMIEKCAENFYRAISKQTVAFPNSSSQVKKTVLRSTRMALTPQESEQLSEYVSNDQYVQKQKEDIQELSEIFRTLLGDDEDPMSSSDPYIRAFSSHFHGIPDISVRFTLEITDEDRCLYITADGDILHCTYKQPKNFEPHVTMKLKAELLTQIIHGETTLQSAFRTGNVIAKGDFKILRSFDELFRFE